jgi:hypothetical protein
MTDNQLKYIDLYSLVSENADGPLPYPARQAVTYFMEKFDTSLLGILFYGSCLRDSDCTGIMDFYVLVKGYCCKGQNWWEALLNRTLPPNVYNLQINKGNQAIRGKYAVCTLDAFCAAVSDRWIHPYFWGRFAQPSRIAYARDIKIKTQIFQALVQSLQTFIDQVVSVMHSPFTIEEFWQTGLKASYATELRAEKEHTFLDIYSANKAYFQNATPLAFDLSKYAIRPCSDQARFEITISLKQKTKAAILWKIRRITGKLLSIIRLLKGSLTFQNSFDYVIWKLEKHSGHKIHVNPVCRKHPAFCSMFLAMRLYREKLFK